MKKTLLCALSCLMVLSTLSACLKTPPAEPYGMITPTEDLYEGLDMLKPHAQENQSQTGDVAYCIVLDDGLGMKGFNAQYCTTYRAALTAVMDASIGGNRTYLRASQIAKNVNQTGAQNDTFFKDATKNEFFLDHSNDVASVIENSSRRFQQNDNQVIMLVSDLMIPTEDGCMRAVSAIRKAFLEPDHATIGVISILGDFRGDIENLPINSVTGRPRTIREYMVRERDENGIFRHPLYVLFMGNDQAVLAAMEKAISDLENGGLLDETNPLHAAYYPEYDISPCDNGDPTFEFDFGYVNYNKADYDEEYIVRGIAGEDGQVKYPAPQPISKEYQQLLKSMKTVKLYHKALGNTDQNVTLYCEIPFTLTDSAARGSILDKHDLLTPAKEIALSEQDYSVSVDIQTLQYQEAAGKEIAAVWKDADFSLVRCDSQETDFVNKTITLKLTANTAQIELDRPILIRIGVNICADPQWEEILPLYQSDWADGMTLNLKKLEREFNDLSNSSSARFTYDSTAKTPFLSNLLEGIADQQTEFTCDAIRDKTESTVETAIFGIVLRGTPDEITRQHWDQNESFGWAYSFSDAKMISGLVADVH